MSEIGLLYYICNKCNIYLPESRSICWLQALGEFPGDTTVLLWLLTPNGGGGRAQWKWPLLLQRRLTRLTIPFLENCTRRSTVWLRIAYRYHVTSGPCWGFVGLASRWTWEPMPMDFFAKLRSIFDYPKTHKVVVLRWGSYWHNFIIIPFILDSKITLQLATGKNGCCSSRL